MPPADEPDAETEGEPKIGMPASVVILAPREAVIMVNGTRLKRSAVREIFQTPRLVKGRNYHYEIVVTLERDGIPVRQTRRFQVQPGQRSEFDFRHLEKKRRLGDEKVPRPAPPKPVVE